MSRVMRKPTFLILTRSDTNPAVQSQKMARGLKFGCGKWRDCTIYVAKTKALISFAVTAKLICVFVFPYAKCWFSHEAAHILFVQKIMKNAEWFAQTIIHSAYHRIYKWGGTQWLLISLERPVMMLKINFLHFSLKFHAFASPVSLWY